MKVLILASGWIFMVLTREFFACICENIRKGWKWENGWGLVGFFFPLLWGFIYLFILKLLNFSLGVGLDDLQRFLPSLIILWLGKSIIKEIVFWDSVVLRKASVDANGFSLCIWRWSHLRRKWKPFHLLKQVNSVFSQSHLCLLNMKTLEERLLKASLAAFRSFYRSALHIQYLQHVNIYSPFARSLVYLPNFCAGVTFTSSENLLAFSALALSVEH